MRIHNDELTTTLHSWHASGWKQLPVAVLDSGPRGFAVADTLTELGAKVLVVDTSSNSELSQLLQIIGASQSSGALSEIIAAITAWQPRLMLLADPAHPLAQQFSQYAQQHRIVLWSDLELAWYLSDKFGTSPAWLNISGDSAVSDTAHLAAAMLHTAGKRVAPVGVDAPSVLDAVRDPAKFEYYVVGLTAADTSYLHNIAPHASALLNVAAAGPATAFSGIYDDTKTACIYNRHSPATEALLREAEVAEGCRAVSFGLDTPPRAGLGLVEDVLADRGYHPERGSSALELGTLALLAAHGLQTPQHIANFLAAAALARACDTQPQHIAAALATANGG